MLVVSNDRRTFVIAEENVSVPESLELDTRQDVDLLSAAFAAAAHVCLG